MGDALLGTCLILIRIFGMVAKVDNTGTFTAFERSIHPLQAHDAEALRVFKFKFFAGYGTKETADALQLTVRTVERYWTESRCFLAGYVDRQ